MCGRLVTEHTQQCGASSPLALAIHSARSGHEDLVRPILAIYGRAAVSGV